MRYLRQITARANSFRGCLIAIGAAAKAETDIAALTIRVRGTVQGVGFRPMVWRLARECMLVGDVRNDGAGVLIHVSGSPDAVAHFLGRIKCEAPPLSRIDRIETESQCAAYAGQGFRIVESGTDGETHTQVAPDAATCPACREEVLNPRARRFGYPFTNCTHCGPRFSIVERVPYDRSRTTMVAFAMCRHCGQEYRNPEDRRFHAQPIACHECGPRAWLECLDGAAAPFDGPNLEDGIGAIAALLRSGGIVAIRGVGGFHLACDATNAEAVARLRKRKRRHKKPYALMARDLDVIGRYCRVDEEERDLLESPEAPIVLLEARGDHTLPHAVAPGMNTLGFMLPTMPLHQLMLRQLDRPIVMTSGNLSDEPQVIANEKVRSKLNGIADYVLFHDRDIANRIDDSVARVMGGTARLIRRARGYTPGAILLPVGFETAPDILAYGGDLKATFCLLKDGAAILSQPHGDLGHPAAHDDYRKSLSLYEKLYDHKPVVLVADKHPEYLSANLARNAAADIGLPLVEVQHHHAHIASCLAENGIALQAGPVIGVAFDGLGFGDDGTLWGGEFLVADYHGYVRVGCLKPVAMLGGDQAAREPWRNTYAHIMAAIGWPRLLARFPTLELVQYLDGKPRALLDHMLKNDLNSPLTSSCGRLFDAVSAAIGLCRDRVFYEGQAAVELEAIVCERALKGEDDRHAYPISIGDPEGSGISYADPTAMWHALLGDLDSGVRQSVMATRFHKGLAILVAEMVGKLVDGQKTTGQNVDTVALSGGCFQNKMLLEQVTDRVLALGLKVISQARVPANDGGLALGQVAIAAARHIREQKVSGG